MPRPTPMTLTRPLEDQGPVPEANQPGHHPEVEQDKPLGPPPTPSGALPRRFGFRFEPLLEPAAALVGVRPGNASVLVDQDEVTIRFGRWSMCFPREDVAAAEVTGPYEMLKVAGPPRLSLADRGITFATNRQAGVCICLTRPHKAIEPLGLLRHPGVTVTVDDPDGLCELLAR